MNKIGAIDVLNLVYNEDSLKVTKTDLDKPVLKVKAKATHAGRLTASGGLYLPSKMIRALKAWTTPYKKPVLIAHNDFSDAIGRVQSAKFIKTPPDGIDPKVVKAVYNTRRIAGEETLWWIDKISKKLFDPNFEGFGYTQLTYEITDELAIEKILDERYLTLSVGMASNAKYCSVCGNDVRSGKCDHYIGQIVDNKMVFGIYDELMPLEVSYVNIPADDLAITEDVTFVTKDHIGDQDPNLFLDYIQDAELTLFSPGNKSTFTTNKDTNNSGGNTMKLTMKSLFASTEDNYKALKKYLSEDARLSEDELKKLGDDVFIGTNRTFPAIDMAHVEAIEKLLKDVNDSAAKREFVEIFNEVKKEVAKQKQAQVAKDSLLSADIVKDFENDELKQAFDLVKDELVQRGVIDQEQDQDEDELTLAMEMVKNHNKQLKQILEITKDSVKDLTQELVDAYAHMIVDLKKFADVEINDENEYIKSLKTRTIQSLKDLYTDIRDSLRSNKKNINQEEDPTMHNTNDPARDDVQQKILDQYNFLLKNVGASAAQDYLKMKIESGEFKPKDQKE